VVLSPEHPSMPASPCWNRPHAAWPAARGDRLRSSSELVGQCVRLIASFPALVRKPLQIGSSESVLAAKEAAFVIALAPILY